MVLLCLCRGKLVCLISKKNQESKKKERKKKRRPACSFSRLLGDKLVFVC